MALGIYGAGGLGRSFGRFLVDDFFWVDDTAEKVGTFVDGRLVLSLHQFAQLSIDRSDLYIFSYQPGLSFEDKKTSIEES